jgi:hypothetical protein
VYGADPTRHISDVDIFLDQHLVQPIQRGQPTGNQQFSGAKLQAVIFTLSNGLKTSHPTKQPCHRQDSALNSPAF